MDAEDAARWTGGGRTLFACSRHEVTLRLTLPRSRKMRPTKMLRQPIENKKKAETSAKSSTWCESMAAPSLYGRTTSSAEERRSSDGGVDLQAFHGAQWAQAKFGTKHGEKPVEKRQRPPNLGEDKGDDLESDEEPVENGPKLASGLVRDRAVPKRRHG